MKPILLLILIAALRGQTWEMQDSGTTASLRGLHAVNRRFVWASGTRGTFLRTVDGGVSWRAAQVAGATDLDFRDVHAIDDHIAWLLSAGPGNKSRVYKSADAGEHWTLQFTNPEEKGFFDSFAFWDERHGIIVGDPVDGHFAIFTTTDAGAHWSRQGAPLAEQGEGAFAASGTCVTVRGKQTAWFVTGGPGGARVFRSLDGGRNWTVSRTPVRNDRNSAGIFSIAFADDHRGAIVGGDYANPHEAQHIAAITRDGGRSWTEVHAAGPQGFRSAVTHVRGPVWIATGTTGSDISNDDGVTWTCFDARAFNAVSFVQDEGWAAGPEGRVARFRPK